MTLNMQPRLQDAHRVIENAVDDMVLDGTLAIRRWEDSFEQEAETGVGTTTRTLKPPALCSLVVPSRVSIAPVAPWVSIEHVHNEFTTRLDNDTYGIKGSTFLRVVDDSTFGSEGATELAGVLAWKFRGGTGIKHVSPLLDADDYPKLKITFLGNPDIRPAFIDEARKVNVIVDIMWHATPTRAAWTHGSGTFGSATYGSGTLAPRP